MEVKTSLLLQNCEDGEICVKLRLQRRALSRHLASAVAVISMLPPVNLYDPLMLASGITAPEWGGGSFKAEWSLGPLRSHAGQEPASGAAMRQDSERKELAN